jgi:hypothetical protein
MRKFLDLFRRKDRRHQADRRQRSMPVARDRRAAVADRRGGAYAGA